MKSSITAWRRRATIPSCRRARSTNRTSPRPGHGSILAAANRLLDEIGLTQRGTGGIRQLPDGEPLRLVAETAGEDPTQVAILQLIRDSLFEAGIKGAIKPEQRDLMRNRGLLRCRGPVRLVWAGERPRHPNPVAAGAGADQSAAAVLAEVGAALREQWPFRRTDRPGTGGDAAGAEHRLEQRCQWCRAGGPVAADAGDPRRAGLHHRHRPRCAATGHRQRQAPQRPQRADNWEPGAHFGVYHPDTFWFDEAPPVSSPARRRAGTMLTFLAVSCSSWR